MTSPAARRRPDDDDEVEGRVQVEGRQNPKYGLCEACHHRLLQHFVHEEHRDVLRCEVPGCHCAW